ncbi:MAG: tyrosine-type recombinase/integrase [Candidatus Sulfotelmatobacter sp.]
MRARRHAHGSVRFDRRRGTWGYLWYEGGKRRSKLIGTKQDYPTKASAWKEVERLGLGIAKNANGETMRDVIARYEVERMPSRHSTAYVYKSFLKNHISPQFGDTLMQDIQPRPVELWLRSLQLSPKSKTHIRSLMHSLLEFAMWSGALEIGRNPISLVRNIGATKRIRKAPVLTVEQFHALLKELHEPFDLMALLCVCLGLRVSEALGLRWDDVDWLQSRITIRRGVVMQHEDECKTKGSAKPFVLADDLLNRLKVSKQASQFSQANDWIFASPFQLGRLPYSYSGTRQELVRAAKAAGIGHVSTHSFRHSYRSWLSSIGTGLDVTKLLMRHSTIAMSFDTYGETIGDAASDASRRIAELAFRGIGAQAERESR